MKINDLSPSKGSRKDRKRVGRGTGSGHGKTSCRGSKGQKSRSGGSIAPWFEGGQMPIQRRLPKRGFTNIFKKEYSLINIRDLSKFDPDASVDSESLLKAGLINTLQDKVKLLGQGEISVSLSIKVHRASKSAMQKIETAGGKIEIVE
ncbi:50S ribosomal protein L15 [Thermodesulfobacteriota bacterium]